MRGTDAQLWAWQTFAPVMALEALLPTPLRRRVTTALGYLAATAAAVAFAVLFVDVPTGARLAAAGLAAIAVSVWLFFASLELFRRWFYYYEFQDPPPPLTFETAHVLYATPVYDATAGLLRSYFGVTLLARLGASLADAEAFLKSPQRALVSLERIVLPEEWPVRVGTYAALVYGADASLQRWLAQKGIQRGDVLEAAALIDALWRERKEAQRWWTPERVGRLPPFGRALSYGQRFVLDRYSMPLSFLPGAANAHAFLRRPELRALEEALLTTAGRNVLVVGSAGSGAGPLIAAFAHAIAQGTVLPELLDKVVVVLDWEKMVSDAKEGGKPLEARCEEVFSQALHAGNVVLVVPNVAGFIEAGKVLGVDVVDVMEPYLDQPDLPLIFLVDRSRFETLIRSDARLTRAAAVVEMKGADYASLLWLLWHAVLPLERKYKIPMLIPALRVLADAVVRYISSDERLERGIALAERILARAAAQGKGVVDASFVREVVSEEFSVPLTEPTQQERQLLLQLESLLAREVVGQEEALRVVAQALRRARAGVRSRERPIGSFLFLGPTGVGKTQTAKALAKILFGDPNRMVRFDMTEYRGPTALARLIGDPSGRFVGALASALRSQPFAVYLLDEFEKTETEVHDLFLHIFDEGRFTDGQGEVVYARDALFIATSNAASDLVWDLFQKGESPAAHQEEIINTIVSRGIFKPELLNRFDAVVVFQPLSRETVAAIARKMVDEFVAQLEVERGIRVVVSDATFAEILERGYDPRFGARPMRRAIQDILAQRVADAILAQGVRSGGVVEV